MATVKFNLRDPKENGILKDSEVSINLRMTISATARFQISTGEKVQPKFWDFTKQVVKSKHRKHVEINQSLSRLKDAVIQQWRDNRTADVGTLRSMAEQLIKSAPSEKKTVIEGVVRFIAQYATEKEASTVQKYKALLSKLQSFDHPLTWESLDLNFLDAFKTFLYSCPNPTYSGYSLAYSDPHGCYIIEKGDHGKPVPLMDDVVFKYIINLKVILQWCADRGYPVNPAFKKWKVINREYKIISLTRAELSAVEDAVIAPHTVEIAESGNPNFDRANAIRKAEALNIARDYFLIECRTGQRISDIMRFDIKQVTNNKWTFNQKKGSRMSTNTVTIPFIGYCAPAYWIFQKYNFRLPKVSNQNLNYAIKDVLKLAGVDQEMFIERWSGNKRIREYGPKYSFISSHTGRKTFITLALGDMPETLVMQIAGIKSYKTLNHYKGEVETETVEKYLLQMEDKTVMKKAQ